MSSTCRAVRSQLKRAAWARPRRMSSSRRDTSSSTSRSPRAISKTFSRIHQHGRVAHHFRKRAHVRGDHRSSACHRFQRRQAEAFIARREHERRRRLIKTCAAFRTARSPENGPHAPSAANHRLAHRGVLRYGVADNHQAQILVLRVAGKLLAHHGERFHQARHVLVAADVAGVEKEWVAQSGSVP